MKLLAVVPALAFVPLLLSASLPTKTSRALSPVETAKPVAVTTATKVQAFSPEERIVQRKLRIERLLISLDRVASVAIQMQPVNAQRLEPVIVDLAEQTLSLVGANELQNVKTDTELDRLEETVGRLVKAMNRMIEPEMSL